MTHTPLDIDLDAILQRHPDVPVDRAHEIATALRHCSPRMSRSRLVATWRAGGMPPAELDLAEAMLAPPEVPAAEPLSETDLPDAEPTAGDFSGLPDADAEDPEDLTDEYPG